MKLPRGCHEGGRHCADCRAFVIGQDNADQASRDSAYDQPHCAEDDFSRRLFREQGGHSRDETGDYDYESLHALDLERLNSDLTRLLAGEVVNIPTYSFELGRRVERAKPLKLDKNDVLLIEGIHGLNPEPRLQSTLMRCIRCMCRR